MYLSLLTSVHGELQEGIFLFTCLGYNVVLVASQCKCSWHCALPSLTLGVAENHRLVWVGRGHKDNLIASPSHGQGCHPLVEVAQGPIPPGLELLLESKPGRGTAQAWAAVLWKGFSCANCTGFNLHRCWHTKACVAGSLFSSHRSVPIVPISCKPHALISPASV